jgi:hypothetical protein
MDAILRMAMTSSQCRWALFTWHSVDRCIFLHMRVCSLSTTVTSANGIILSLSVNLGIKSASELAFPLESSGILPWAPICYLTGWLLNDIMISWKLLLGLLEDVLESCKAEVVVSALQSSSALWRRCLAMVEHNISRKVEWTGHGRLTTWLHQSPDLTLMDCSCVDTWRSTFMQFLPGLFKIS